MDNIFIKKEKRSYLTLNIFYLEFEFKGRKDSYFFHIEEIINEEVKDKVKKITAKFLIPTFEEHSEIKKGSTSITKEGYTFRDEIMYQQRIIQFLLKKIITDDEEIEIDEENYGNLHPNLAETLYKAFDHHFLNPNFKLDNIL